MTPQCLSLSLPCTAPPTPQTLTRPATSLMDPGQ
ncbi:zinc finger protein 132 isoform X2 [Prionailurus iriomotensis]